MAPARPGRVWKPDSALLGLAGLTLAVLVLRLPSFFEPPWHTDEGIFAAVAQRVLSGGRLYADAWESKPPLFLYTYVALFKVFEPAVWPLRLAATAFALGTHIGVYFVARRLMLDARRALLAAAVTGVLLGVPFWEGTLALTEVFTVLPTTLGVLCVLLWTKDAGPGAGWRWLLVAGVLFGLAFLFRQTSALAAASVALWLVLSGRPWLHAGTWLAAGFALAVVPVVAAFAFLGDFYWFWDANVGFFLYYVPSGQELPFAARPIVLAPVAISLACLVYYHRHGQSPAWGLPALWFSFTLAGAMLTGRPYSHYMLQAFPPLALILATVTPLIRTSWRPATGDLPTLGLAASLVLTWVAVVTPMFAGSPFAMRYTRGPSYYVNFAAWTLGLRSESAYNDYFDRRVNETLTLTRVLRDLGADDQRVYIWGEYPWVYALAGLEPATRYTTSFYVLLLPYLDVTLGDTLARQEPAYIVVLNDARPRYHGVSEVVVRRYENSVRAIEEVISRQYSPVAGTGKARVYRHRGLSATPSSGIQPEGTGEEPAAEP